MRRALLFICLAALSALFFACKDAAPPTKAPDEGIYKLDFNFLSSAGFNPDAIDPRTIKIYNNGGKTLSENLLDPRPVDLVENAIKILGENL